MLATSRSVEDNAAEAMVLQFARRDIGLRDDPRLGRRIRQRQHRGRPARAGEDEGSWIERVRPEVVQALLELLVARHLSQRHEGVVGCEPVGGAQLIRHAVRAVPAVGMAQSEHLEVSQIEGAPVTEEDDVFQLVFRPP